MQTPLLVDALQIHSIQFNTDTSNKCSRQSFSNRLTIIYPLATNLCSDLRACLHDGYTQRTGRTGSPRDAGLCLSSAEAAVSMRKAGDCSYSS